MTNRATRVGAFVAASALMVASCGGDSEPSAADPVPSDPATAPTSTQIAVDGEATDADVADQNRAPLASADDPTVIRASELALTLVGQLGSDDVAMSALLRAADEGYSALQIEAAIVGASLSEDGTIDGVAPALVPVDFVVGLRLQAADDVEPLPIETLREQAADEAGREDIFPTGALGAALILQWQLSGYSQEQIVDMLILGVAVLDGAYDGPIAEGEEECGGYVIGGVHEIPQFCDAETGELFAELEEAPSTTDASPAEPASDSGDVPCAEELILPVTYSITPAGIMLDTEILGPLETPYYYAEVSGLIDIGVGGEVTLTADTLRLADITIRGAPDNQVYTRTFSVSGSIDLDTGDGTLSGSTTGTDLLYTGDNERPAGGDVSGQVAIVCEDAGPAVFGFVGGLGGLLEFEARP